MTQVALGEQQGAGKVDEEKKYSEPTGKLRRYPYPVVLLESDLMSRVLQVCLLSSGFCLACSIGKRYCLSFVC